MAQAQPTSTVKQQKQVKRDFVSVVGRRRSATARVRLYAEVKPDAKWGEQVIKKGELLVNEKPIADYFGGDVNRRIYTEPLRVVNAQNKFAITIRVVGGGPAGQLDAAVLGIARALSEFDAGEYRKTLKEKGFLTRDARIRERRKVGTGGKARRKKQSPKR
jgi:small subunit ribosomal protein S9